MISPIVPILGTCPQSLTHISAYPNVGPYIANDLKMHLHPQINGVNCSKGDILTLAHLAHLNNLV